MLSSMGQDVVLYILERRKHAISRKSFYCNTSPLHVDYCSPSQLRRVYQSLVDVDGVCAHKWCLGVSMLNQFDLTMPRYLALMAR